MPGQAAMLKGTVRGSVLLSGTPADLRVSGGDLAYVVGDAPPTRLADVHGTVAMGTTVTYDLRATAQPLALATLTQLFPALPFRSATLTGPIHLFGGSDKVNLAASLHGAAGGIDLQTTVGLGGRVPTFDLSASLNAFRAGDVLTAQAAPEVPLSGTVAAGGTTEDFRFDVNLLQGGGSLALHGGVRMPAGGSPQFDVAGRAENFRIGVLVGQPNLLAGPVTGPIAISGGGRQPISFNVDLAGQLGVLDLHGWYQSGDVPSYKVAGNVVGLDVSGLPMMSAFPGTKLTATLDVQGQGVTPETFRGRLAFDVAQGSTVGGVPIDAATGRLTATGGQLRIDTLVMALRGARAEASGVLGLTVPSQQGMTFTFRAADLALLGGLFARAGADIPRVEGSLSASGRIMGTLSAPHVIATGTGRGLRYAENRAATFAMDVDMAKSAAGWSGTASLNGTDVLVSGQSLASIDLRVNATPGLVRFGLAARKDAETALAAGGTLEMDGTTPRAALLDTLSLDFSGQTWRLQAPARIGFTADEGVTVRNLSLARVDGPGLITANGTLPPRGNADFTFGIRALDLAELHRLVPMVPALTGTLSMDATVRGPVGSPVMDVQAWVLGLQYGQARADSIYLRALTDATGMNVNAQARVAGRTLLTAEGRLPVTLSLGGTVPGVEIHRDEPQNVRIAADSLPLALLAGSLTAVRDPEGVIRGDLTLSGTPNHPTVTGGARIYAGAVTVEAAGVRYSGIDGSVRLNGRIVTVDSLVAHAGPGWARLFGTADVTDGQHPTLNLTLLMHDFQVIDKRRVASLRASTEDAPVRLSGTFPNATVSGDVKLDDGTIWIPETRTAPAVDVVDVDVGQLGADTVPVPVNPAAVLLSQINAQNLHVAIGEDVWIESPDAHIQITGDVDIDRAGGATRVTGDLEARRGTYTFRYGPVARDFTVERGRVRFYGTPELNPALDIVASHTVRPLDAASSPIKILITVGGTLQNPSIALSSDTRPPLGESELLSLLVFGRRTNDLGALPGQLASDLLFQEALGGLLSRFEQQITRTGIFDFVRITTTSSNFSGGIADPRGLLGSPSLELGKQLSDRWFVTLQVSNIASATGAQALGVAVEGQLTANTTIRAAYEPVRRDPLLQSLGRIDYQLSTDLRRRWEYGRTRNHSAVIPAPTAADTLRPAVVPAGSATPAPPPPPPTSPPPPRDPAPAPVPAPTGDGGASTPKGRDEAGAPR
jgi:autotransporter translocation and assembly factor TamB